MRRAAATQMLAAEPGLGHGNGMASGANDSDGAGEQPRKRFFRRRRTAENRAGVAAPAAEVMARVVAKLGGSDRMRLVGLWRCWPEVLGPAIAELARPLGARGRTLVLGADDPLVMQELSYMGPEILARANGWLGEDHFDKVAFELLSGRFPLDAVKVPAPARQSAPAPRGPERLGGLAHLLASDDAVGRSYRAYVRRFSGGRDTGGRK